uniref:RING-type domain-containing protein n=1 Tax=Neogobius melanostomus TaxID=47308 RepID=A0A8C6SLH9_9GOBI
MEKSSLESFLTCSVCLDILTEPVSLSCHHSFCKRCLTEHWARHRPCPVCRRTSSKEDLDVNFALKEVSISFRQKQWSVCPSHPQVLPLFCLDDSRPLCPLCEFSLHPQHRVVSGEEAQRRLKELISSQLQALTEEKHQCEELQQSYEEIQLYAEKQAGDCERHIRAGFSRLHQFLQEEEQRALSALREEQLRQKKNISPELEKLREKLSSVDKIIQELQQQLETHTYRPRQESTPPRPRPKAGLLLDQAKVLGNLGFRVWTRMRRLVTYQPVVLDPNTAYPKLSLSDDLSLTSHKQLNASLLIFLVCNYPPIKGWSVKCCNIILMIIRDAEVVCRSVSNLLTPALTICPFQSRLLKVHTASLSLGKTFHPPCFQCLRTLACEWVSGSLL